MPCPVLWGGYTPLGEPPPYAALRATEAPGADIAIFTPSISLKVNNLNGPTPALTCAFKFKGY